MPTEETKNEEGKTTEEPMAKKPSAQASQEETASRPPPTSKLLTGDEEDTEIEAKAKYEVTGSAFRKRIDRSTDAALLEMFGTKDRTKILADQKRLKKIEEGAEAGRKAKLDTETRLKEENASLSSKLAAAEARAEAAEEERIVDSEVRRLSRIAGRHIDGDYVEDIVHGPFKRYLSSLSEREHARMDDKDIAEWFAEYAKQKPKFAKDGAAAAPAQEPPKKVPATNGLRNNDRPSPNAGSANNAGGKDPRPGRSNSMNAAEYQAYKAQALRGGNG